MDRSTKSTFHFVNLKHPDDLKDDATQLRIRRLAMTEAAKARRKPKTKRERNEMVLEFRSSVDNQLRVDQIGSGEIDPFCSYPIELDDSARELLANIFGPTTNHSSQLRGSWYAVGLSCAAAFHSVLSNSRLFLFQKLNGFLPSQDDAVALTYHHKALQATREMVKDQSKHKSDEVLGSITGFMCHLAILGNFSGGDWYKHRSALARIVELRGGFDKIDKEHLRITLTWVDLVGCFGQDIPPLVPLPHQWQTSAQSPPHSPRPLSPLSLAWKQQLPMQLDWVSVFDDIAQLISLDQAFNNEQLLLANTSGSWMEPTMYRLLAIRPLLHNNSPERAIEEVCRLGTLLFLSPFWRLLGQSPVWTAAISRNLLLMLTNYRAEWKELKPLLAWVLYFAAIETKDLAERSMYVSMLAAVMTGMELLEWDEMLQVIKGVLWVEKVFASSDELIRDEVVRIVREQSMGSVPMQAPAAFWDEFSAALDEH
ncbi:hypothetical protein IQ06DRAFT_270754 [Phaeosphaeriaceae sp. SRC1lsM3a]|nr:hypothetical protein IQ06DRAFT_270754 [Stagonospora sp. SRC1lsM3a]